MSKVHVKKDDTVYVLTGKDAGVSGKVLQVLPDDSRVLVEGVNMVTKHKKPRGRGQQGGLVHQEAPVSSSNVMLVCPSCKRPTKIARKILPKGGKVRVCKHCGETIDTLREDRG